MRGHFRERGCFDLYCTQGPFFTNRFEQIRAIHPHFSVVGTGWPKTDTLFNSSAYDWPGKRDVKTIQSPPSELKTKPRIWLRKLKTRKKQIIGNFDIHHKTNKLVKFILIRLA
jgi:hypothetical protein